MVAEKIQTESSPLSQFFSSPKTVEEQFPVQRFNPEMIQEVEKYSRFFTEEDVERTLSCSDPKECLYTVAGIISRIRWEQEGAGKAHEAKNLLHTEEVRQRLWEILLKKQ